MADWIKRTLEALMGRQERVLKLFPEEKRLEGHGRAADLLIDTKEGIRVYKLWFTKEKGVEWRPSEIEARNIIYMSEKTFEDLIMGWITPKEAIEYGLVKISGLKALYDSVEFAEVWEKVSENLIKPIAEGVRRRYDKEKD